MNGTDTGPGDGPLDLPRGGARFQVPYSAGDGAPRLQAPADACDAHQHIYDTRVPSTPPDAAKPDASVADYRMLQARIGTRRVVVVNPSNYAFNNDVTLNALQQFGPSARGIAVINTGFSRSSLASLHDRGIRGIRITRRPVASWDDIETMAGMIADLGWHIQFNIDVADVLANLDRVKALPVPIVFDHLARLNDVADPALGAILGLIDRGNTWVKLSGVYVVEPDGAPDYPGAVAVGRAFVGAAPERMVWGSDWPHPSARIRPDDAVLFDLNLIWAPTEALRERILVRNPAVLYGFDDRD